MRTTSAVAVAGLIVVLAVAAFSAFFMLTRRTAPSSVSTSSTATSRVEGLTVGQYNTTVPSQYAKQFSALQAILDSFNSTLRPASAAGNGFVFSTELLPANCNRGQALLRPGNLAGVAANLNALKVMGVQAVTVCIGYPLLDPSFPNSSLYLSYYVRVARMVHAEGMKFLVESHVLFANTPYSTLAFDWSKLPYQQYVKGHAAQDQLIIDQVRPDYLDIGAEADTEALLTGYSQLDTPSGWTSYIEQLLSTLNSGGATKLVAGAGTWLGVQFVQGFAGNPKLDFISTHVYPIYGNNLVTLVQMGRLADQVHKRLVIDEAWEQKVLSNPNTAGRGVGGPSTTPQDVFGYSSPTDQKFLKLMVKFSRTFPVEYFSPFAETYFFAYLNWTSSLDGLGYFQLDAVLTPLASQNIQTNTVTPTGLVYADLAHGSG